jgi:ABC-type antimicrobial peptide transport system permease subunit
MIRNYFKVAFRNFWRHKLFTLINVIGLSIGISAALVIYLLIHYDLTFDKFHKDGHRIYRVVTNFTSQGTPWYASGVCGPLPWATKTQVTGLEETAPIWSLPQPDVTIILNNDKSSSRFKKQDNVVVADSDYFRLFEYKWLAGSAKSALSSPYQVVLTSDQAEKYFPGVSYDQMLGRTVVYDTLKTTVSGIVQSIKQNTDFTFHDFISFPTAFSSPSLKIQLRLHNWGGVSPAYQLFVKLAPQVKTARIEQQLNDIEKKNLNKRPGITEVFALQPLADIHFNTNYGTFVNGRVADKTTLVDLSAIALFLLLLGCINFINLTTAQSAQRAKEIGIRKTLGSDRKQLILQFLSETFLITLVSVIISVAITPITLQFFSGFIPPGVHADMILQPNILLFLALLMIIVSLASGFYPAIVLSGYKPVSAIKNQAEGSHKTRNAVFRKSLTVTQFAIAQFFIMATILVSKQVYYAIHKNLGFKKDAIVIVNSPLLDRKISLNRVFLNKLNTIPGVELVSMGYDAPTSDYSNNADGVYKDGKKEIKIENLTTKFGDENYIKVYHIKLLAGRNLIPADTLKSFLINNTLAKQIGFNNPQDAIGKIISKFNGDRDMRIVGVVSDFNQESIHAAITPLAILTVNDHYYHGTDYNGTFHIALKAQVSGGNEWKTTLASMEKAWKQVYPNDDFEYQFFDESIAKLYANEQKISALLSWATGLSILISCLGLLGLAIYTTNQRTKEIGVRKVLGATVTQIVVLLSAEMAWLIVLAFVVVSPVAWWAMNKWMQDFADKTTISWWIFALSGGGMLLTALLASGFRTVKAALENPVKSLRSE